TSETVGTGQTLGVIARDARAAETVFYDDLGRALVINKDEPCFIISSQVQPAFRNRTDEAGDRDGNPLTRDLDNDNQEGNPAVPGEVTGAATYNERNHRFDTMSFFGRDAYRRQTGNDANTPNTTPPFAADSYAADMVANEAWICYGHLWLP